MKYLFYEKILGEEYENKFIGKFNVLNRKCIEKYEYISLYSEKKKLCTKNLQRNIDSVFFENIFQKS